MEGWPFLISRSRRHDYRAVVAPRFLVDDASAGVLGQHAGGDPGDPPQLVSVASAAGPLSLYFRVVPAASAEGPLTDGHGREVVRVEGLVIKGRVGEEPGTEVLDRVHGLVAPAFRAFWESDGETPVQSLESLRLEEGTPGLPARKWMLAAGLVAVAVAAVWNHTNSETQQHQQLQARLDSLGRVLNGLQREYMQTSRQPNSGVAGPFPRLPDSVPRTDSAAAAPSPAPAPSRPADPVTPRTDSAVAPPP